MFSDAASDKIKPPRAYCLPYHAASFRKNSVKIATLALSSRTSRGEQCGFLSSHTFFHNLGSIMLYLAPVHTGRPSRCVLQAHPPPTHGEVHPLSLLLRQPLWHTPRQYDHIQSYNSHPKWHHALSVFFYNLLYLWENAHAESNRS